MSLLLDALKKAAEKNSAKDTTAKAVETTQIDMTKSIDKTVIADQTEILDKTSVLEGDDFTGLDTTKIDLTTTSSNQDQTVVDSAEISDNENITEIELAQIINAQKEPTLNDTEDATLIVDSGTILNHADEKEPSDRVELSTSLTDDDTEIHSKKLAIEDIDVNVEVDADPDPSLVLYEEDEDPSLKLALSDEEILLTDDDVTEFLGGDELDTRLGESELSLEEETDLKLVDSTTSLNLAESATDFADSKEDTTSGLDLNQTATNLGQTTNLNSLTNDATLSVLDRTSTQTFASDNYDRTLVKIDDDVSKVFTGLKSEKSGAAMTPDFAKKVFVLKSSSMRRQNYKIYGVISLVVLVAIGVLALFEMQTQIEAIDTSLARLKQNPVPSALRFKRKEKNAENASVLKGRIDTEALNLLKSLAEKNKGDKKGLNETEVASSDVKVNEVLNTTDTVVESKIEPQQKNEIKNAKVEQATGQTKIAHSDEKTKNASHQPASTIAKVKSVQKPVARQAKKAVINIKSSLVVSKESIWLKEAYDAFENGNIDVAARRYQKVLSKNAQNRDALLGQAAIYVMQNRNTLAINNYQAVLLENPKDPLAMTSLIAASTLSPVDSESRLKVLLRESPKATYLQFALGNVVSAQNRWQEAQQYYFEAYQAEPKNPDYAYNLAVSLEQINQSNVAVNYYKQALNNAKNMNSAFNQELIKERIEVLSQ